MEVSERVDVLLSDLGQPHAGAERLSESSVAWLREASEQEIIQVLQGLAVRPAPAPGSGAEQAFAKLLAALERGRGSLGQGTPRPPDSALPDAVATLYSKLGANSRVRWKLLSLLAVGRTPGELAVLARMLANDPPQEAAVALAPLFRSGDWAPEALFPDLLDAVNHLSVAAPALDLMNFLVREGRLPRHPAESQKDRLAALLGQIVGRLGQLEDRVSHGEAPSAESARQAGEGVTLAVSLCDTLGLIGDPGLSGKLTQAMQLRHRRIRVEAAAALARLDVEDGKAALIELAAEPVARLRVLAYAEELGLADRMDETYATPEARAEAELASWLAEPTQMGLAPQSLELLDTRELYWPGYEQPITCRLFRFAYQLGGAAFENIGISGPMTFALSADLTSLSLDEIYATFAGWQAEHEEIFEIDAPGAPWPHSAEIERLKRRLRDEGYTHVEPITLGSFFGDKALVAQARKEGEAGWAVADVADIQWRPQTGAPREPGADEAYWLYKGKRLLEAFNQ